jgi:hypothetical protein
LGGKGKVHQENPESEELDEFADGLHIRDMGASGKWPENNIAL